jgi:tRNA A37 threonylcarbamoyladenosine modification protein TsaB
MLLALNTCGSTASIALGEADTHDVKVLATAELAVRTYSARLIPEIAALLESRQVTLRKAPAFP